MIKDSYGRWTFPKGHIESNETLEETARREIAEETGLDEHQLIKRTELGDIEYWFTSPYARDRAQAKDKGPVTIHKFVTYYLFELSNEVELIAQPGEVEAVDWVPLDELLKRNEYEDNIGAIKRTLNWLASHTAA